MDKTASKPIAPCPNPECGQACIIKDEPGEFTVFDHWWWAECEKCGYRGPCTDMAYFKAVELHNTLCERRSPSKPQAHSAPVSKEPGEAGK